MTPSSPRAADLKPASAFAEDEWVPPGLRGRAPPTIDIKSPKYRSAARRVTLAMIAAPIAIVTSYHLAMRTWGGVEQKKLDIKQEQEDA
ncbi:MAG: hypothetical protein GOMPHAMPRED_002724 [Gomphillus americanus]|uniref:Uncharacterized protein n=1 Tax=Gomphillus americanus TaxID=1940652 RepID=A0A8H3FHV1_9LECA|nr:MAG: hypothetical protein GOMPHAMPRED_002724 [Gomphillus americanus]